MSNTYSNQLSSELELSSEHGDSISENESQVNNSSLTLDESQLDNNDNSLHAKLINMIQEYTVIWKISSNGYKDRDRKTRSWEEISKT